LQRNNAAAIVLVAALIASSGERASAHRLDEYLQAARIGVEADRVDLELLLTPGAAVADTVLAAIDPDGDGVLATEERERYIAEVLGAIEIAIDGRSVHARATGATFPELHQLRGGEGAIRIQAVVDMAAQAHGPHRLLFRNHHQRAVSVYLANALVPRSDGVAVTAQLRDAAQHELTIEYVMGNEARMPLPVWPISAIGLALVIWRARAAITPRAS